MKLTCRLEFEASPAPPKLRKWSLGTMHYAQGSQKIHGHFLKFPRMFLENRWIFPQNFPSFPNFQLKFSGFSRISILNFPEFSLNFFLSFSNFYLKIFRSFPNFHSNTFLQKQNFFSEFSQRGKAKLEITIKFNENSFVFHFRQRFLSENYFSVFNKKIIVILFLIMKMENEVVFPQKKQRKTEKNEKTLKMEIWAINQRNT